MAVKPSTLTLSSVSPDTSSIPTTPQQSPSRVKQAARAFAGVFTACLSPSSGDYDFQRLKSPTASSPVTKSDEEKKSGEIEPYNPTFDGVENLNLTKAQIYKATNNFSSSLELGQGGFGKVYKGTLKDGTLVAIKRALKSEGDEHLGAEFRNEIRALLQVKHRHLVKLLGFLEDKDERMIIVEYIPNGTLRQHLDGKRGDLLAMDARLDIAIHVAHAITYLHVYTDKPIIHRDIKSSNILLTNRYQAKVADFGFAREAADRDSGRTHESTQVRGTAGYVDPEYMKTHRLTVKSDVYSFGALLVELMTGRRPIEVHRVREERITTTWAFSKFAKGEAASTIDPRLEMSPANVEALERVFELAFKCLASKGENRPAMQQCAQDLWIIRKHYSEMSTADTPPTLPRQAAHK